MQFCGKFYPCGATTNNNEMKILSPLFLRKVWKGGSLKTFQDTLPDLLGIFYFL
jgi:hypothetical protein